MDPIMLVKSPGYIFGPLMLLGGIVAVAMCVRASLRPARPLARRALIWSAVPATLGVLGAIFGGVVWALADQPATDRALAWSALGHTVLFGVLVAAVPLVWSLVLLRRRPLAAA